MLQVTGEVCAVRECAGLPTFSLACMCLHVHLKPKLSSVRSEQTGDVPVCLELPTSHISLNVRFLVDVNAQGFELLESDDFENAQSCRLQHGTRMRLTPSRADDLRPRLLASLGNTKECTGAEVEDGIFVVDVVSQGVVQHLVHHHKDPARPQRLGDAIQRALRVGQVVDDVLNHREVEAVLRVRSQVTEVSDLRLDVVEAGVAHQLLHALQRVRHAVGEEEGAGGKLGRQALHQHPRAAPELHHLGASLYTTDKQTSQDCGQRGQHSPLTFHLHGVRCELCHSEVGL